MNTNEATIPQEWETQDMEQQEAPALPGQLEVTVRPIEPRGSLIGFASVNFGGIVVNDFKIFDGEKGMFVGNPSKPDKSSRTGFRSTARVVDPALQTQLNEAVRDAYIKEVAHMQARAAAVRPTPEKPRLREQLEQAAQDAARDHAELPAPDKGKGKSAER